MYQLSDLLYLMERLRTPVTGCPWDLKQTYETIVSHTLEEAHEVVDAIERGDKDDLKDELGDLLFQVVFYAQLGREEGAFEFSDVVNNIVEKLLRRHPHVFPNRELREAFPEGTKFTDDEIKQQWEKIKAEERMLKSSDESASKGFTSSRDSVLKDIPKNFPTLTRAEKLQKRAAQNGFDWPDLPPVFDKLEEEIAELKVEIEQFSAQGFSSEEAHRRLTDEMGDVLFCCVNLARFLKVNPDEALRSTNNKFVSRFQYLEEKLLTQGKKLNETELAELDALWDEAKLKLRSANT